MADTAAPRFLRDLKAPAVDRGQAIGFGAERPLVLDSGKVLSPFTLAYMTYGTLNPARSNAILVAHALTGDQFAAGIHPGDRKAGLVGCDDRAGQAHRH